MAKSYRHVREARRQAVGKVPQRDAYEITDPFHKPDLNGEFAGAKVKSEGGKQIVRLTKAQAQFYLDQGAIVAAVEETAHPQAKKPTAPAPTKPAA